MTKIPRTMSTQHPDNVNLPFFAENSVLSGEDEIQEAFYAFSHLGCDEQMWDCEGKEVDNFVVKKLLTKYEQFFKERILGQDVFLTLRVPNPNVEKTEAKVLLETLESISRSFDTAKLFYGKEVAPIFEVILPMTTSAKCLDRVFRYYQDFVVGKENKTFRAGDITIADWIGEFKPKRINVIPLFEDHSRMLNADKILKEYLKDKRFDYQRVFLARSDPALNYGLVTTIFLNKIALWRLDKLSKQIGIKIYPIIGVGSVPFRGGLKPKTVARTIKEYPSCQTFTIQSAFKYDNHPNEVIEAIKKLEKYEVSSPLEVDEKKCLEIIKKYTGEYQRQVTKLAPAINKIAKFIPSRRKRHLHVGLFGYSRKLAGSRDLKLPRAIGFTAAMYSLGLPPELLGLNVLEKKDFEFVKKAYINFEADLKDALKYYNQKSVFIPKELKLKIKNLSFDFRTDKAHQLVTNQIIEALTKSETENLRDLILRAGSLRKFLG